MAEVGHETVSYSYVPGAGDDEESWARGLTPALFWQHHQVSQPSIVLPSPSAVTITTASLRLQGAATRTLCHELHTLVHSPKRCSSISLIVGGSGCPGGSVFVS